jgi:hypothetical protein
MGELDRPLTLNDQFLGKVCSSRAGFDGNVNMGTEGGNDSKDGFRTVLNGLIGENLPLLIHDTDLEGILVVVDANINW